MILDSSLHVSNVIVEFQRNNDDSYIRKRRRRLTVISSSQESGTALLIGKSSTAGISAAKKIINKAVYCIDNLSFDYSVEDVRSFVSSMGIDVISCFEVKPRRRRNEELVTDRKAFRICICADDRERFLDDSKWPDSVAIFDWFFKQSKPLNNPQSEQPRQSPADKRRCLDDVTGREARRDRLSPTEVEEAMDENNDNETTILLDSNQIDTQPHDGGDY